ncbi:hypothetical protein CY34DRAFT_813124 [Suillus luteus UH-Slu-Lm8-n1]|uniref:Uncharacterized protein n=1 Tax=Suillus luteus UH-Slu-Lm8-n1 TaxID=930992 RepID=A0A0C9ZXF6_9AGAM|nr:hypothetical protein CY34DRAFT_813124 [Suillus luteus UH-Slu-Lm8-n1]
MPVGQSSFCMAVVLIIRLMHCMQEHPTIREDPRHEKDLEAVAPPQALHLTHIIIPCPLELR